MRLVDITGFYESLNDHETVSGLLIKLSKLPTIDTVPVVRCKECKHLNVINNPKLYAHCPKTNTVFLPFDLDTREHFCSLGEEMYDSIVDEQPAADVVEVRQKTGRME